MKILIVDDYKTTRVGLDRLLRNAGHTVLSAENLTVAIDHVSKNEDINLVITDLNIPHDHEGLELISMIKNIRPMLAVILISNTMDHHTASAALTRGAEDGILKSNLFQHLMRKGIVR